MRNSPYIFLITITIILTNDKLSFAQKEANVWYFGSNAGIDFNSGVAVAITNGAMYASEGCATICDEVTGDILFYTNGATVWNANHQVMTNGTGLTADASSAQAAVIVPDPGNSNQYYIFTAGEYFSNGSDGYRYSIVDMSLSGGLGAITAVKNVLLYAPACEKLAAIKNAAGTGYWIVTHKFTGSDFVSFELTSAGISAPVISSVGTAYSAYNPIGCMKFAPGGARLATILSGLDQVEVYDFDAATGEITNAMNLGLVTNLSPYVYGIGFSPNGKRLYVDEENYNGILQYDLDAGSLSDIIASKTVVGNTSSYAMQAMQLGPDGKLYLARQSSAYLAVIHDPDSLGIACDFEDNGFNLAGAISNYGLPAYVESVFSPQPSSQVNIASSDTMICEKFCIDFYDSSGSNIVSWLWQFPGGSPSSSTAQDPVNICYDNPGTFDVTLITTSSAGFTDTLVLDDFITVFTNPLAPVITQNGNSLTSSAADFYQWYLNAVIIPGATSQTLVITQSGLYTVVIADANGCNAQSSIDGIFTGIGEETSNSPLDIRYNPSTETVVVTCNGNMEGEIHISIYNSLGEVVMNDIARLTGGYFNRMIDIKKLPNAVYFVKVSSGGNQIIRQLVTTR